jgi:CheY-like chemotaxis protein
MQGDGRRVFVLIADDNRALAKGLSILLTHGGFDVEIVHDGTEVLRAALARKPDVLLLDIGLPGMDGFEVADQLRNDQQFREILIIAISAYSPDMLENRSDRVAFDHRLVKPVNFERILSLLAPLRGTEDNAAELDQRLMPDGP